MKTINNILEEFDKELKGSLLEFISVYECYGVTKHISPEGKETRFTSKELPELMEIAVKNISKNTKQSIEDAFKEVGLEEETYTCRFHPTDSWHEVGCPHDKYTLSELNTSKNGYNLAIQKQKQRMKLFLEGGEIINE